MSRVTEFARNHKIWTAIIVLFVIPTLLGGIFGDDTPAVSGETTSPETTTQEDSERAEQAAAAREQRGREESEKAAQAKAERKERKAARYDLETGTEDDLIEYHAEGVAKDARRVMDGEGSAVLDLRDNVQSLQVECAPYIVTG